MLNSLVSTLNTFFIKTPKNNLKNILPKIQQLNKTLPSQYFYTEIIPSFFKQDIIIYSDFINKNFSSVPQQYCKINKIQTKDSNFDSMKNKIEYPIYIEDFKTRISRTKLFENNDYEIVLIGWEPGAKSTIHNHASRGCIYFSILGDLVEERYNTETLDLMQTENLLLNDVEYIDNNLAYHKIKNTSNQYSFSLHIYSPTNFISTNFEKINDALLF